MTREQWLMQKGGRTLADVNIDEVGEYILMRAYGKNEKVYLPKELE